MVTANLVQLTQIGNRPDDAEIAGTVEAAVDLFIDGYRMRQSSDGSEVRSAPG